MKAVDYHLYIRGDFYYYRCRLPKYLSPFLPREFVIALKTKDLNESRMLSVKLDYELDRRLKEFQTALQSSNPEQSPEQSLDKLIGHVQNLKALAGINLPQSVKAIKASRLLFSYVAKKYMEDCSNSPRTSAYKDNTFALFKELMGDLVFKDIGIAEAREFKERLRKIPANAKKYLSVDSFEGLDLENLPQGKAQHPSTINNRHACLVALFSWAIKAGYYHANNPFSNLAVKTHKSSTRRHPFKPEELETLFRCSIYTGSRGEKWSERLKVGNTIIKDSWYWVPLIGLYSGMRMNEICQLYVEDIRQEEGVYIFDVNDDGDDKALKTPSSRRKVPIHNELIDRGLLVHLEAMRKQGEKRLFPDVTMGSVKTYSSNYSKRFTRLLKDLKLKRQGLCFHSLRHNFIDGLRNAGVERSIVMTLTGHQSLKGVHDDYGYGYNMKRLQEEINRLQFKMFV